MKRVLIYSIISLSCLVSCSSSSGDSFSYSSSESVIHRTFAEEFVDGTTVNDYADLELSLFDSSVMDEPEGMPQDEYENYKAIYQSPFQNKNLYENSKIIEYHYRDYYCVFYYKEQVYTFVPGQAKEYILGSYYSEYIGFPKTTLNTLKKDHGDEPYDNFFKFLNVSNLDDAPYIYEGFYAYNVIHLIDLYDGSEYLNTTFDFNLFTTNDSNEMCFYDVKVSIKGRVYDIPYNQNNSYFAYYNRERYDNMKIVPYLPHPYWHDSPMMTRNEVDDEYVYYHLRANQIKEGELLVIDKTILQYDPKLQKSVEKVVTNYYAKVPIKDVIPVE